MGRPEACFFRENSGGPTPGIRGRLKLVRNAQLLASGRPRAERKKNYQEALRDVAQQQDCFASNGLKRTRALRLNVLRWTPIQLIDKPRRSTRSLVRRTIRRRIGPPTPHKSHHAEDRGRKMVSG